MDSPTAASRDTKNTELSCGEWDARAQRCCALVDTLCDQPLSGRYTAFGAPSNFTACGVVLPKMITVPATSKATKPNHEAMP